MSFAAWRTVRFYSHFGVTVILYTDCYYACMHIRKHACMNACMKSTSSEVPNGLIRGHQHGSLHGYAGSAGVDARSLCSSVVADGYMFLRICISQQVIWMKLHAI